MALPTLPHPQVLVTLGVDTHAETHIAAALDQAGRLLATRTIPTTPAGYAALLAWASTLGCVDRVGVEGTGSYGAGLARWLRAHGQVVVEVDRPDRAARRRQGKADDLDAQAAARAVQAGAATGTPKAADGQVEMIRSLRLARRSAVKARTQAANQLGALLGPRPMGCGPSFAAGRWPSWSLLRPGCGPTSCQPRRPTRSSSRCGRSPAAGCGSPRRSPSSTRIWSGWSPRRRQRWLRSRGWAPRRQRRCWSRPGTTPSGCVARARSRTCVGSRRSLPPPARPSGIG